MKTTNQVQKKAPAFKFVMMLVVATLVILVLLISPWNIFPTLVTEDVTVIAVTNYGCVAESMMGVSVVVQDCNAKPGDVISATFYIPAMELNGYYDRVQEKLKTVNP